MITSFAAVTLFWYH